jgi:hypothetical protein
MITEYKDKISGETLYVRQSFGFDEYYKDKATKIRHRLDGPAYVAYVGNNVYKEWYVNDRLHRLDGPAYVAYVGNNVYKEWYVNGIIITRISTNSIYTNRYRGPESLQDAFNRIKIN